MQASEEENSVTVVAPPGDTYADSNLNEKNLGTKYIYTTQGELIPADEDHNTSNLDLNAQHYNTNHVTAPQTVNIHQVDFQFEQQYPEGTAQVESVNTECDHNQANSFVLEPAEYGPESAEPVPNSEQVYSTGVGSEPQATTYQEYSASTEVADVYTSEEQPVMLSPPVTSEPVAENGEISAKTNMTIEEISDNSTEQDAVEIIETTVEKSQPKEDLSAPEAKGEPDIQAADEDETNIQSLKSNPAIEIQSDEVVDAVEEVKHEESESNKTEIITLEHAIEGEDENVEEVTDTKEESTISKKAPPRPRGRKLKTDIPLHILGHDVNKPMDNILNGKSPKPRLGVKVPYRNLTSQIVTKKEIEQEILERGKKKRVEKKDLVFTQQLTSRLSKRIVIEADEKSKTENDKSKTSKNHDIDEVEGGKKVPGEDPKAAIDNNIDLLAILEGDGDPDTTTIISEPVNKKDSTLTDETNLKNLEREIALQQLQDLPFLSPKTKFIKGNKFKVYSKGSSSFQKRDEEASSEKAASTTKLQAPKSPIKTNMAKLEVNKPTKVNVTLKTYSRKRKSSENTSEPPVSPSKKPNVSPSVVEVELKSPGQSNASESAYVTKSSRVIKRKVIWDPDEASPKAKISASKGETTPSPKLTPKNENKPTDQPEKIKKTPVDTKPKIDKKVEEKRSPKKANIAEKKSSPVLAKQVQKLKKPRSEVDKLLGDEGAIKMLYDLKNSENYVEEKRRKTVFSVEKTFKDLAKKANQIKTDLVNTSTAETPKSLRKKEPFGSVANQKSALPTVAVPGTISRQKSKDSARSTPPPSPSFSFPNEVSYLIRRRSSSSISSAAEDTGGSLDLDVSEESKKKPIAVLSDPLAIDSTKKTPEQLKSQKRIENWMSHYKTLNLKKNHNSVTIELHSMSNATFYFTAELLGELTSALNKLSKEKDCHVVLLKSINAGVFSKGIDYKSLVSDKENARKLKAKELANQVKTFLQSLLNFPKVLVVGVQGECSGLAVTILPLFDIVIASDDAQFSTSYSSLGCAAEGAFLLTVPHVSNYGLAGELLLASQKLTADEAYRRGLISKLCWPEKYQDTVRATVSAVAQGSKQSLEATKKILRIHFKDSFKQAIDSMEPELIEHWTSAECQSNFNKLD